MEEYIRREVISMIKCCELIDELLKGIQHLELECISTRCLPIQHMYEEQRRFLLNVTVRQSRQSVWREPPVRANGATCL